MNYSVIKDCDIADGVGVRVSLFVSGCNHHCAGCHNQVAWDFNYGEEFTEETEEYIFGLVNHSYIDGITLLGGEPMEPANQPRLFEFVKKFRKKFPEKSIWCYTGFTFENLIKDGTYGHTDITVEFLKNIDILIDGLFIEKLKNISLRFRGSSNQRIIDIKKTFEKGEVVLAPYKDRVYDSNK